MRLTQRMVTKYARYGALRSLLDAWIERHRAGIIAALNRGACPDRGPYLLALETQPEPVNWRGEFYRHLRTTGYSAEEIEALFAKVEARKRGVQVRVTRKVNPGHRGKVVVHLPPG